MSKELEYLVSLETIEVLADQIELVNSVATNVGQVVDIVEEEPISDENAKVLYNTIIKAQNDRILDCNMVGIDDGNDFDTSFESVVDTLKRAGNAIVRFLKNIVEKIKNFLGLGKKKTEAAKEDLKEKTENLKANPIAEGIYTVPSHYLATILRGWDENWQEDHQFNVETLTDKVKENKETVERYSREVLTPIIPFISEFDKAISAGWFIKLSRDSKEVLPYRSNIKPVTTMIRRSIRFKEDPKVDIGVMIDDAKTFSREFDWKLWDGEKINAENPQIKQFKLEVRSPDHLVKLNTLVLSAVYVEVLALTGRVEMCNSTIESLVKHLEDFHKASDGKHTGNFWNPKRVRELDSLVNEVVPISRMNAKVLNYITRILDDVNKLNDYLQSASDKKEYE